MKIKMLFFFSFCFLLILQFHAATAQLSGDYTLNGSFYDRDEDLGTNTTQYLREHASADSWLFLNYRANNIHFSIRHDLFHNSPLHDPEAANTQQGIAFYSASIDIDNLTLTVGSFYDQFGSGILFRSFEDRQLGIDYAIEGVRLAYEFTDNFSMKAFTGRQKTGFDRFEQVVMGAEADYYYSAEIAERPFSWRSRASVLNRTIDSRMMDQIVAEIESYDPQDRFVPKYNLYGYSLNTTLRYAGFNLDLEFADKSQDAIRNPDPFTHNLIQSGGFLWENIDNPEGYAFYTTLGYTQPGLGISFRVKQSDNFIIRSNPFTEEEEGVLNYIPSFTRQHAYRLPARYGATNYGPGELGFQLDGTWSPVRGNTFNFNLSSVETSSGDVLFREVYADYQRRWSNILQTTLGLQQVWYNQEVFEVKPGDPQVVASTGTFEARYRLNRQNSIRTELQYMFTDQDLGDFAYIQLEYNISPNWSFSVSDMINTTRSAQNDEVIHFYSIFASYRQRQTQYTLSYAKQPEGVVCTGGVCRVEPAFSGMRFGLTTNF